MKLANAQNDNGIRKVIVVLDDGMAYEIDGCYVTSVQMTIENETPGVDWSENVAITKRRDITIDLELQAPYGNVTIYDADAHTVEQPQLDKPVISIPAPPTRTG